MKVSGKIAVVTGGGRGIGRAVVLTLAREGADIAIFYRADTEAAESAAEEVRAMGRKALAIKCDVSRSADVNQAMQEVLDKFGVVDILVNNAAIAITELFTDTNEENWDKTIDTNLKGQFLCTRSIVRHMIGRRQGKIINFSSIQALVSNPYYVAYAASKGGVLAFTRALATELAGYNINVNAVVPGITATPMNVEIAKKDPTLIQGKIDRLPLRRQNQPEDVANVVLFLASEDSRQMVGQYIVVDAGTTALHSGYQWPTDWPPEV